MFQPEDRTAEEVGTKIPFSFHGPADRSDLFIPKLEEEKEKNARARESFHDDVGTPAAALTAYATEISGGRDIVPMGMI